MSKTEEVRQAALKLWKLDPERPTQADPLLSSTAGQIGSQPESPPAKPKKSEDPRKLPKNFCVSNNPKWFHVGVYELILLNINVSDDVSAVAQYLKGQSSTTPVSEGQLPASTMPGPGDLSLNAAVLEGKSRKICARMFFETLVLKNCGLIDVKQEEPYGDITLKTTSKLWKEQL
nr:sister chromatid cohesion 1 protein 3 isoform X1 [Ipomoea trifida]